MVRFDYQKKMESLDGPAMLLQQDPSPVGWVKRSVTHRATASAAKRIRARIWIAFVTTRSSTVIVNERRTGHIRDFIDNN